MISRNFSRRLARIEASLMPTSDQEVVNVRIISSADGSIIDQFSVTCEDDPYNRHRRTPPWRQRPK
jgi:hypothetical protein